jgi:hypothetical protein
MYLIFTNDLGDFKFKGSIMIYADDVAIVKAESKNDLLENMKHDILLIEEYYNTNCLVLNINKSKIMYFGNKSVAECQEPFLLNGETIESVPHFKYLGLIIDSRMNFKVHIDTLANKISSNICILWRVRGFMPRHILINLFSSLIHSNLIHLIEVFGSASKELIFRFERLQRRALKIIFNLPRLILLLT